MLTKPCFLNVALFKEDTIQIGISSQRTMYYCHYCNPKVQMSILRHDIWIQATIYLWAKPIMFCYTDTYQQVRLEFKNPSQAKNQWWGSTLLITFPNDSKRGKTSWICKNKIKLQIIFYKIKNGS